MAKGAYTYNPANVKEPGTDRMRFELGDVMVDGLSDTTALTDEEIQAAIDTYPKSWKRAKLMLLESLCRRFSYEVNTKTGPLTLELQERAKLWREDYEKLKKDLQNPAAYLNSEMRLRISRHIFIPVCRGMKGQVEDGKYEDDVCKAGKPVQRVHH